MTSRLVDYFWFRLDTVLAFLISDDVQYNATDRVFIGLFRTIQSVFFDRLHNMFSHSDVQLHAKSTYRTYNKIILLFCEHSSQTLQDV